MAARMSLLGLLALGVSASACTINSDTRTRYEVVIHVNTDNNQPVQNAQLSVNNKPEKMTGPDGSAVLSFLGNEGENRDIQVACPTGLKSPTAPIPISLRRMASPTSRPEFTAECPASTEVTVVAIRAVNGANLPVMYQGKEIARTDGSGAANVALRLTPNDQFSLILGTDEPSGKLLSPKNPSAAFTVKDHDDIVPMDTTFTIQTVKKVIAGPRRHVIGVL